MMPDFDKEKLTNLITNTLKECKDKEEYKAENIAKFTVDILTNTEKLENYLTLIKHVLKLTEKKIQSNNINEQK
jgi:hydrogenase maturation factor HypE